MEQTRPKQSSCNCWKPTTNNLERRQYCRYAVARCGYTSKYRRCQRAMTSSRHASERSTTLSRLTPRSFALSVHNYNVTITLHSINSTKATKATTSSSNKTCGRKLVPRSPPNRVHGKRGTEEQKQAARNKSTNTVLLRRSMRNARRFSMP